MFVNRSYEDKSAIDLNLLLNTTLNKKAKIAFLNLQLIDSEERQENSIYRI